jgi:hypothetical protein
MRRREPDRDRGRSLFALGLSALFHLALAVWLLTRSPLVPRLPEIERLPVLDVEITGTAAPGVPPALVPGAPAVRPAPAHPKKGSAVSAKSKSSKPSGAPSGAHVASGVAGGSEGTVDEVPRRLRLEIPEVLLPHLAGELDDLEGGHTFREDPRVRGRSDREKAVEAESRIQGWLEDDAAERRVADGRVDPWFGTLRRRFEHDATEPKIAPQGMLAKVGAALVEQYLEDMHRFGATGNPNAAPPPDRPAVFPSGATGVSDQLGMLDPANAPINAFGRIGQKLSLVAVVDLRQDADGSLLSAEIVVRSGNADFDRYVLDLIPKSMERVPPPPDAGLGFHAKGSHSVWEFAGRLTFARDLRELNLQRDGWYFLPLSVVSGINFDETTGYIGMMVNPYYKCQVRLLRVY